MQIVPHNPQGQSAPYTRRHRVDVEPLVSAVVLMALVVVVNAWQSPADAHQASPSKHAPTQTASSRV